MRHQTIASLIASEHAVTAIEYALLASLIAVVIVAAVGLVGAQTLAIFSLVSDCVSFAISGTGNCP